jgi:transcriptional regulator with GAF, ATPase, and Fis domain
MFFLEKFARKQGRQINQVTEDTMARLCRYPWPGNIRELQNVIERAVVLSTGSLLVVEAGALPEAASRGPTGNLPEPRPDQAGSLDDMERQHITAVLTQTNWKIEGGQGAAKILNLQPSTLRSRMRKLGITRTSR